MLIEFLVYGRARGSGPCRMHSAEAEDPVAPELYIITQNSRWHFPQLLLPATKWHRLIIESLMANDGERKKWSFRLIGNRNSLC